MTFCFCNVLFPTEVQEEAVWMTLWKGMKSSPRPSAFHRSQLAESQRPSPWMETCRKGSVYAVPKKLHPRLICGNHNRRASKTRNAFKVLGSLGCPAAALYLEECTLLRSRGCVVKYVVFFKDDYGSEHPSGPCQHRVRQ